MKPIQYISLGLLGLILSACTSGGGGGGGGNNVTEGQPDWNQYEESAQAASDFAAGMSDTTRIDGVPTKDSASMSGVFEAESGGLPATLVGEMDMEADFGAGTVTGELYNTFIDYGTTHAPLSGSLNYDGSVEIAPGETVATSIDGEVPENTDIIANGESSQKTADGTTYNIFLDLFGDVHEVDDNTAADGFKTAVDGLLEGNVTVSTTTTVEGEEITVTDPTVYDLDGTYVVYEDE